MKFEEAQKEFDELHNRDPNLSQEEKERHTSLAFVLLAHRGNHFEKLLKLLDDIMQCKRTEPLSPEMALRIFHTIEDAKEVEGI